MTDKVAIDLSLQNSPSRIVTRLGQDSSLAWLNQSEIEPVKTAISNFDADYILIISSRLNAPKK